MDALISISSSFSLSILAKATVMLMAGLLVHRLTPKFSAAVRHLSLFSVFAALLVLPAASIVLPRVQVVVPKAVDSRPHAVITREPSGQAVFRSASVFGLEIGLIEVECRFRKTAVARVTTTPTTVCQLPLGRS